MSNTEIVQLRKITVLNTLGSNRRIIESSANTWGELQQELGSYGIPFEGMRAVIGETQNTLEQSQSSLLPGDMTLFLMGQRVKSGI